MTKTNINLTIDAEVIEYHRAKRTELSKTVNDYLVALMGKEAEKVDFDARINELQGDLAKAMLERKQHEMVLSSQAGQARKDEMRSDVLALVDLNKRRGNDLFAAKKYEEGMQSARKKYGLHMAELLAMVEGRKGVPQ